MCTCSCLGSMLFTLDRGSKVMKNKATGVSRNHLNKLALPGQLGYVDLILKIR